MIYLYFTGSQGDPPLALHQVRLPIVPRAECDASYPAYSIMTSQVCAGDVTSGGVDSCQVGSTTRKTHRDGHESPKKIKLLP